MSQLVTITASMALLGSALIAGVFFAFSSFVMKALGAVPSSQGIAAMQSINVVVINRSFLGTFFGTAVFSLLMAGLAIMEPDSPAAMFFVGGAIFYIVGTFFVTVLGNVPLNNRLAKVVSNDTAANRVWKHYLARWTMWNHVRTVSAVFATLAFIAGLLNYSST